MAVNKRISSLTALGGTPADTDIIPITDVSDTTGSAQGTTKKVTVSNLMSAGLFSDIVSETTTARTLSDSDCGKVIDCNNASAITITLPSTVSAGFNCTVVQSGAGQVTIAAGASVNLYCYSSAKATAGQYAAINIIPYASNSYVLEGDLAASGGGGGGYSNSYSLNFDGTDDYLTTSSTVTMGSSTFSFSWWAKKTGNIDSTAGLHWFGFGSSSAASIRALIWSEGVRTHMNPPNSYTGINHANWQAGWNHLVYTMDGATHTLYWNGSQLAQVTSAPSFASGTGTLEITRSPTFSSVYVPILLDEFSIFDATLSSSDVTAMYNSGVPNDLNDSSSYNTDRTNDLIAWYRMGETDSGTGTTITNAASGTASGGSSFDLSFGGAPTFSTDVP